MFKSQQMWTEDVIGNQMYDFEAVIKYVWQILDSAVIKYLL